jgi:hypothetical protein
MARRQGQREAIAGKGFQGGRHDAEGFEDSF